MNEEKNLRPPVEESASGSFSSEADAKSRRVPRSPIRGACCAVVTPFSGGEVDLDSFGRVISHVTAGGVSSLVVCGTTGESSTLTDDEQQTLVRFAVERAGVPVLCGASSNSTRHAAMRARNAIACGAAGCLCVTPYYNKASEDGMVAHYRAIAEAAAEEGVRRTGSSAPVVLYNVPSRTGSALTYGVLERLADVDNIVGIKEASGDVRFAAGIVARFGERYEVYSGCDELNQAIIAVGGRGAVSVTANVFPAEVSALCGAALRGDTATARAISDRLRGVTDALFSEVNPIPVKAALAAMGLCREEYRLPLCPLDGERRRAVVAAMHEARERLATIAEPGEQGG